MLTRFFSFLPPELTEPVVTVSSKFVGEGWHLTLGLIFVLVVVFLPGGIMEGVRRIGTLFRRATPPSAPAARPAAPTIQPAE